jgi:hypothetical protein
MYGRMVGAGVVSHIFSGLWRNQPDGRIRPPFS